MQTIQEWVLSTFPYGGFYVEAGAHDGVGDSTTHVLENTNLWNGICVEPSSAYRGLCKNRTCKKDNRCLWSTTGETVNFMQVKGSAIELSGIAECFGDHWDRESRSHKFINKETVSLTDLLTEHAAPPMIHFLSLDTEGSEFEILSTHNFDKFPIRSICVEHNGVVHRRERMQSLLKSVGFSVVNSASVEDWFLC